MPRTGSTSITQAIGTNVHMKLFKHYGASHMGFIKGHPAQLVNNLTHQNLSCCVRNFVGERRFLKSFKFAGIRNPFDRAISMWKNKNWIHVKSFTEFCHLIRENKYETDMQRWHVQGLYEHLVEDKRLLVDHLLRFENLQQDFNVVCDKMGVPPEQLPHLNKSYRKHYTEYYDDETREIVAEKYAKDIEYFGYKFGE